MGFVRPRISFSRQSKHSPHLGLFLPTGGDQQIPFAAYFTSLNADAGFTVRDCFFTTPPIHLKKQHFSGTQKTLLNAFNKENISSKHGYNAHVDFLAVTDTDESRFSVRFQSAPHYIELWQI